MSDTTSDTRAAHAANPSIISSTQNPASVPLDQLMRLTGKVAVVTGGGRGIGEAICRRLAELGASVIIADRELNQAEIVAQGLSDECSAEVVAAFVDVADEDSIDEIADATLKRFERLDIWVNNAGVFPQRSFAETDRGFWTHVQDVNVLGVVFGSQAAARSMPDGGVIINIASIAGTTGLGPTGIGGSAYVASKHAVVGLTRSLAAELGPRSVRVVAVAPGLTMTPGVEAMSRGGSHTQQAQSADRLEPFLPLGRPASPDDIARVVAFMATDAADYITGSVVVVDGGQIA